jgi:protoheme IX farnesyltransferase
MRSSPTGIKDYLELAKIKIMIPVSLTGFTGYFAFDPHISSGILLTTLGIFLLAVSSSVLNQIQEVEFDVKMNRTSHRPLPSRKIKLSHALIFFFLNLLTGASFLYAGGNLKAVIIGLFTIFWYNVVYTYAKRITSFAVVPGAITGALPPLIGWVAAGGIPWDKPIIFIGFLIFTGQIPHFWLLILRYGDEYKNAGFPTLTEIFTTTQINRLTFSWVVSSVFAALFLCYFEIIQSRFIMGILVIASAYIIWQFSGLIRPGGNNRTVKKYSILLDLYFLLVLLLLISDRIIR